MTGCGGCMYGCAYDGCMGGWGGCGGGALCCIGGLGGGVLFRLRSRKMIPIAAMPITARPPTTPPTMAPTGGPLSGLPVGGTGEVVVGPGLVVVLGTVIPGGGVLDVVGVGSGLEVMMRGVGVKELLGPSVYEA